MLNQNENPSLLARIGHGISGGLCAGSLVGIAEASWILTSTTPSEYQAIRYGALLYGVLGGMGGLGFGVALGLAARYIRMSPIRAWCIAFFGIFSGLGLVILRYILNKQVYLEKGVPMTTTLAILAGLAVLSIIGIWVGGNILQKTPLRVLPKLKGTVVAWGGMVALASVFSMAPAPGAAGNMQISVKQGPEFASKPNVILVMMDTLRADALGVYGAGAAASPGIDGFARDAVIFDQFVTSASWTRASTASLMTSRVPSSHSCETKDSALPESVITLAERMSEGGYATGGLPNNANVTGAVGFGQGFSWYPYTPEYPLYALESSYSLSMYSLVRKIYTKVSSAKRIEEYYMPAPTQLARAREFIEANSNSRWFSFIHLMDAHDPYFRHPYDGYAYGRAEFPNPDPARKDELKALYAGEVKYMDEAFGAFIADLKAKGIYDNSLIIVTADHGEEFMEHGGWWHGTTLYDEQIRVPLIIKLPNNERAGTRVPWQVRQIDIAPTIAELSGLGVAEGWQGGNLFDAEFDKHLAFQNVEASGDPQGADPAAPAPLPTDPPPAGPVAVGWDIHPGSREAVSEQNFEGYDLQSLRWKGMKYIEALAVPAGNSRNQTPQQLFNLKTDPAESANIAGQGNPGEAEMKVTMEHLLEAFRSGAAQGVTKEVSCSEAQMLVQLGYLTELPPQCQSGGQ